MTTATRTTATRTTATRAPMTPMRKTALVAGVLYLVTFVTSIPALGLYGDVLHNPDFVLGAGSESGVLWGALLEVICGLAGIGTAVFLYRVARRDSERAAVGFVAARGLEAAMIFVGVVSLLAVVTLRQDVAGTSASDAGSLVAIGQSLVAVHNWTFLLGPGVMPAISALCIATVMYRTRLIPRIIPTIGLIGAPILVASSTLSLFGAYDQVSTWAMLAALPIAVWEFSFGVWMAVKGFRSAAVTKRPAVPTTPITYEPVAA